MGCAVSRAEKVDVVALCRERKRSLKLAIKSRRALSYEHVHSFLAVAAAIRLFVARHTSQSSPFLKFYPLPSAQPMDILLSKSVLLQEKQLEQDEQTTTHQSIHSFDSQEVEKEEESFTDYEDKNENNKDEDDEAGPYYSDVMSTMPCPREEYNWNSYNLFDGGKPKEVGGSSQNLNEENLREEGDVEGIQELDAQETETGEALVADDNINETEFKIADLKGDINLCQEAIKDPMAMENPERSRDLLNALKHVEDQFVMSFDSVKDATQMLATNNIRMQSSMKNVKDNSPKPEQAIKWPHSTSSLSSSCKSLLSLSSRKSSTWTVLEKESSESKGGAESESHLLTLEKLYAWEKKLYKNVKVHKLSTFSPFPS